MKKLILPILVITTTLSMTPSHGEGLVYKQHQRHAHAKIDPATQKTLPKKSKNTTPPAAISCQKEIGKRESQKLVKKCIEVSPATHPPCNAANSCDLIRDEIKRSCNFGGVYKPSLCK